MNGKIITNPLMNLVFVDNFWIMTSPKHNQAIQLDQALNHLLIEILMVCRDPYTMHELVEHLILKFNLSKQQAEHYILALLQNNLLTNLDVEKMNHHLEVEQYLGFRYSVRHADYSDSHILEYDKDKMQNYQLQERYPMPTCHVINKPVLMLEHPAYLPPTTLPAKLAAVLFYAFGCIREATFLEFLPVLLKCAPSKGARHPFDAYILDPNGVLFPPGHYYYCPMQHCLYLWSDKSMGASQNNSLKLQIILNFERYQWRYRHSWAYKDIFFDLGHIIEILKSAALHLGLKLSSLSLYDNADLDKILREEICFTCEVFAS